MSIGLLYWILMLLWFLFGVWVYHPLGFVPVAGFTLLQFILFFLLGWRVFGAPLQNDSPRPQA